MLSNYILSGVSKKDNSKIYFNTKNGVSFKINSNFKFSDKQMELFPEVYDFLKSTQFLEEDNELDKIHSDYIKIQDESLYLIIMTHQNCNFRCTYCYEKFDKGAIKSGIILGIKKYTQKIIKANKIKKLYVSWFGGEPLLST